MFTSFRSRIFWAILLVACISSGLSLWLAREWLEERQLEDVRMGLMRDARLTGKAIQNGKMDLKDMAGVIDLPGLRLSLVNRDGRVVAETGAVDPEGMDNHLDRPEVAEAKKNGTGYALRNSGTLHTTFAYAAQLLDDGCVVRLALPLDEVNLLIRQRLHGFASLIFLSVFLAALMAAVLSGSMRRSLDKMVGVVTAISCGRLHRRLRHLPGSEFAPLAEAVNRMASGIEKQVSIASDKTAQLESVLNTMRDGVLVLGPKGRIRRCNGAFARLFPDMRDFEGRTLIEVIPSPSFLEEVESLLQIADGAGESASETDAGKERSESLRQLELHLGGRFFLVLVSIPLPADERLGAVLVFRDVTDLLQLERIRSDFVANVSHELRTPLTAIQGYAETLLGLETSEQARHFAGVIYRQSRSIARILEDLLLLARLEGEKDAFSLLAIACVRVFEDAAVLCKTKLLERNLTLQGNLEDLPPVMGDERLLVLVFRNLLENACRFASENTSIRVVGERKGKHVVIRVVDDGLIIPRESLPRIFERFYQVKRESGQKSTGLGLAICKHIIERHGGEIWAESPAFDGSAAIVFTLQCAGEDALTRE